MGAADDSGASLDPHVLAAITAAMAATAPKVTYDVADLLDRMGTRIDAGFAEVKALMSGKADKEDLARINARLDEHGREIGHIKDRLREDEAAEKALESARVSRRSMREWSVSTWVAIAGVASSGGFLIFTVVHK